MNLPVDLSGWTTLQLWVRVQQVPERRELRTPLEKAVIAEFDRRVVEAEAAA